MKQCTVFLLFFLSFFSQAQPPILLTNPSFEGTPGYGQLPGGWVTCAFNRESPPDTHPVENGRFGVAQRPQQGQTYLGMVVRDNNTTEFVSQKTEQPFRAGQCYTFSLYLCKSEHLHSLSRTDNRQVDYDQPTVLRVWGGLSQCGKKELLATSPAIDHTDWRQYSFRMQPLDSLSHLTFEAYFAEGTASAYNGNLLLDHVSPIVPMDCQTGQLLVDMDTFLNIRYDTQRQGVNKLNAMLKADCPHIGFPAGKGRLPKSAEARLLEVARDVKRHGDFRLEVALSDVGRKLNRQRARALQRIFKKAGLQVSAPPQWEYPTLHNSGPRLKISVRTVGRFRVFPGWTTTALPEWPCGEGGLWLRATIIR